MNRNPDPIDVEVGRRLATRRRALGLNQTDLARAVGRTFQQIQKYEKGTNRVSCSVLFRFAAHLGVTPAYFFPTVDAATAITAPHAMNALAADRQGRKLAEIFADLDDDRRAALLRVAEAIAQPPVARAA